MTKGFGIALLGFIAMLTSAGANASSVDYATPGTINAASYSFVATNTGDVYGYFYGSSASDTAQLGMSVDGGSIASYGLKNHASAFGQSFDFGHVNSGDILTFILDDLSTATLLSSDPALNKDSKQHVYSTAYSNPSAAIIPDGQLISFEDRLSTQGSDFDYNDDSFVLTNVTDPPALTPLPSSFGLFGLGLGVIALAFGAGKRSSKRQDLLPAL